MPTSTGMPDRNAGERREREHPGPAQEERAAGCREHDSGHAGRDQRSGAPLRSEVEAQAGRAEEQGEEPDQPELASRRDEQQSETRTPERAGEARKLAQGVGSRTNTAAREACPFAETVRVKRPGWSGARNRSVPGRATPLRPPSDQPHATRVGRDPQRERARPA